MVPQVPPNLTYSMFTLNLPALRSPKSSTPIRSLTSARIEVPSVTSPVSLLNENCREANQCVDFTRGKKIVQIHTDIDLNLWLCIGITGWSKKRGFLSLCLFLPSLSPSNYTTHQTSSYCSFWMLKWRSGLVVVSRGPGEDGTSMTDGEIVEEKKQVVTEEKNTTTTESTQKPKLQWWIVWQG